MKFRDDIHVSDRLVLRGRGPNGPFARRVSGAPLMSGPKPRSNVTLSLLDPKTGKVVTRRKSHNIFLDYGRDYLVHLASLDAADTFFREDRVKYMALGIGGTAQRVASADLRNPAIYNYPGFPDQFVAGAGGVGDPVQTHTDATVTALEFPVESTVGLYYSEISQPATFPATGVVRYTCVLGINEISFGTWTEVPVSEILLCTSGIDSQPGGLTTPPVEDGTLPTEKFGIAYHQFSPLHKTNEFVLQVDWELRMR